MRAWTDHDLAREVRHYAENWPSASRMSWRAATKEEAARVVEIVREVAREAWTGGTASYPEIIRRIEAGRQEADANG